MPNKVLIAGARGVVGASAGDAYLAAGWDMVALSQRPPDADSMQPFQHLACALRDAASSRAAQASLTGVSHVVYAALFEQPGLIVRQRLDVVFTPSVSSFGGTSRWKPANGADLLCGSGGFQHRRAFGAPPSTRIVAPVT